MLTDALNGMAAPWVIVFALIVTTFLVEDVAIAAGAALAAKGLLSWEISFLAVAFGIALGDMLLYAAGFGARRVKWLEKRYIKSESSAGLTDKLHNNLFSAVLLARVIPGLRLLTYTACGFTRASFIKFTLLVGFAVLMWTASLYWLSATIGEALAVFLGIPKSIAVALPILVIALAIPLFKRLGKYFKHGKPQ